MNYTSRYVLTSIDDIKKVTKGVLCGVEEQIRLSEERRYDITLVINELLVNSFEHACVAVSAPVVFQVDVVGNQLRIGVTDSGGGFMYDQLAAKETDNTLYHERGRGLKIVRALCQEIKYNGRGNSVEVKIAL